MGSRTRRPRTADLIFPTKVEFPTENWFRDRSESELPVETNLEKMEGMVKRARN